jgi:hypothetical protein
LGPYRPDAQLKRLEKLCKCLIERKFEMAKLVRDFPDDTKYSEDLDEHFTQKSREIMKNWAHVPIFVFLRKGDNLGVNTELTYTCTNLPDKGICAAVFFEKGMNISSQVTGSIKIARISYESFREDKELCDLAFGHSLKVLDKLFYYID